MTTAHGVAVRRNRTAFRATDTRAERRRFVTNACVYATFVRGID
jgi:hypothetical protein